MNDETIGQFKEHCKILTREKWREAQKKWDEKFQRTSSYLRYRCVIVLELKQL